MRFNIVITDTETGETLVNQNTDCINGACCVGDGKAQAFNFSNANAVDIAATIDASNDAGLKCCADNPEISLLLLMSRFEKRAIDGIKKDGAENE